MKSANKQNSAPQRATPHQHTPESNSPVRPPWALSESLFRNACNRCDDCIKACPQQILFRDNDGYPAIQFSTSGCTFCAECLESCQQGALHGLRSDIEQAWIHLVRIDHHCLAISGVSCRACSEQCEVNAIDFLSQQRIRSLPVINRRACIGCGQCIAACPANAISLYKMIDRPAVVRI